MELVLTIITGIFLLIMAILDVKTKKMPSILPTTAILILIITNYQYLQFAIFGTVFAWLLYEFGYYKGMADFKAIIIISAILTSQTQFFVFTGLVSGLGLIYQMVLSKFTNYKEIPMTPLFFIIFVVMEVLKFLWF